MLARVQVEQELDERPFEPGAPVSINHKTAPRNLGGAGEIYQPQAFAKLDV